MSASESKSTRGGSGYWLKFTKQEIVIHIVFKIATITNITQKWEGIKERLYGSSIFRVLRNHHTVFHSVCVNLHSHRGAHGFPFSGFHPTRHLLSLILAILTSVRRYLTLVLICISLLISDEGNLFMYCLPFGWKNVCSVLCTLF